MAADKATNVTRDTKTIHRALPAGVAVSPQLDALCQRAAMGAMADIDRLAKWASLVENEAQMLRQRLRKQQHDFATLFEIVGQTSARSLDVVSMQTYLLRTISGHFATSKLIIMRRMRIEDKALTCSAAQGTREDSPSLPLNSLFCQYAMDRRFCFSLKNLPDELAKSDEVKALAALGVDLIVPLVQEVEAPGAVLEGMLLLGRRLSSKEYRDEDIEFLHILGKMLAICLRNEALYRRSIIDDLTGVASRGHFEAQLSQELNRIQTYGHRGIALVMLDVDHFKTFNDTHGHQTGDRVLQAMSAVLLEQVRTVDLVARYGGEEFAIILLEIDRSKVIEVANRLRRAVEKMEVLSPTGERLNITASFGVACFPEDAKEKSTLIKLADEALYKSKMFGRNRVTITDPGSGLNRSVAEAPKFSASDDSGGADRRTSGSAVRSIPAANRSKVSFHDLGLPAEDEELKKLERQRKELLDGK